MEVISVMRQESSPMHVPNGYHLERSPSADSDTFISSAEPTPGSHHSVNSPRCEAYLMTGEKILSLNANISPSYAKMCQDQIPPDMLVGEASAVGKRGPFDDFPSLHHKVVSKRRAAGRLEGVPNSQSEHVIGETATPTGRPGRGHGVGGRMDSQSSGADDDDTTTMASSSATVNAMSPAADAARSPQTTGTPASAALVGRLESRSEPNSPARHAFRRAGESTSTEQLAGQPIVIAVDSDAQKASSPDVSQPATPFKERVRQGAAAVRPAVAANGRSDAAARLAKRLYELDGFQKTDVAPHLAKNNEFSAQVAHEYMQQFNLSGLRLDAALRSLLSRLCLTGESSERERILAHFSRRYTQCNPAVFECEDDVHTLACALLLLNSDLHGESTRKRMTCHEFIENLSHTGSVYKRDLLKSLYTSIKSQPIEWSGEEATGSGDSNGAVVDSRGVVIPDADSQVEYKKGWVMRKCVFESDGKKTPFGRRGWRMFFATLKGLVLYLHKDERGFGRGSYQTFQNAIRVHHSIARPCNGYKKRQHVFLLRSADLAEFLFQTSSPEDLSSWVDAVNLVAACFSAPPLAAPCGSQQDAFTRPLLPSGPTTLDPDEQRAEHERQAAAIGLHLEEVRRAAPSMYAKGKPVQQFFFREQFLELERGRYETYAQLLGARDAERRRRRSSSGGGETTVVRVGDDAAPVTVLRGAAGSGQSDRLSYREAIDSVWGSVEMSSSVEVETDC